MGYTVGGGGVAWTAAHCPRRDGTSSGKQATSPDDLARLVVVVGRGRAGRGWRRRRHGRSYTATPVRSAKCSSDVCGRLWGPTPAPVAGGRKGQHWGRSGWVSEPRGCCARAPPSRGRRGEAAAVDHPLGLPRQIPAPPASPPPPPHGRCASSSLTASSIGTARLGGRGGPCATAAGGAGWQSPAARTFGRPSSAAGRAASSARPAPPTTHRRVGDRTIGRWGHNNKKKKRGKKRGRVAVASGVEGRRG